MGSRIYILLTVMAFLLFSTDFEAGELFPTHLYAAWIGATIYFVVMISWQFVYRLKIDALNKSWFQVLAWIGSVGFGVWATFMIFSLPLDAIAHVWNLLGRHLAAASNLPSVPVVILAASLIMAAMGLLEAITGPRVKTIAVPVSHLSPAMENFRIVQISDLHVGPTIRRGYVEKVVEKAMALKPDLIAITGDMADGTPEMLEKHLAPLAQLKAPYGIYYITGNHEYYWGADRWRDKAVALGFIPLTNENRLVPVGDSKLLVGGVTDISGGQFIASHHSDPVRAIKNESDSQFKLLLAHRPESCFKAEPAGFDLQLSGHTHAGQFFPFNLFIGFAHKYYRGLNRHGRMWVYVNAGTGYWGPPHRFLVPSELTLLELKAAG
jgi:predicted MPP superfamily phosphohydrolase